MHSFQKAIVGCVALAVASSLAAPAAWADSPVRFVMDWAFEGSQSIWTMAAQTGCFKQHGLAVTIDRGFGSGDALSKVASGAYDVGVADFSALIDFDAKHPEQKLIATFVISDQTPTSVESLKKSGIDKPQDLAGKRIADPPGEASRVLFPAFARANGIDPASVTWVSVSPSLRLTSLVQGQADAAAGHMFTVVTGLRALGVKDADITVMRYADYGVDLLGNAIVTKPAWAAAHPAEMKAFIGCAVAGIKGSIADPQAAITSLKPYNSMVDDTTEAAALAFSTKTAILTDNVKKNGLSQIAPARMEQILDQLSQAIDIPKPVMNEVYTSAYQPPYSDLKLTP